MLGYSLRIELVFVGLRNQLDETDVSPIALASHFSAVRFGIQIGDLFVIPAQAGMAGMAGMAGIQYPSGWVFAVFAARE